MAGRPGYQAAGSGQSYIDAAAVTPSDVATGDATARIFDALYIGGAGDVAVVMAGSGNSVVFKAPPIGTVLRVRGMRVAATGTTATLLVALYGVN